MSNNYYNQQHHYDPVNSTTNTQQGYTYQNASTSQASSQSQPLTNTNYRAAAPSQPVHRPYYGTTTMTPSATESLAAETMSHLAMQERGGRYEDRGRSNSNTSYDWGSVYGAGVNSNTTYNHAGQDQRHSTSTRPFPTIAPVPAVNSAPTQSSTSHNTTNNYWPPHANSAYTGREQPQSTSATQYPTMTSSQAPGAYRSESHYRQALSGSTSAHSPVMNGQQRPNHVDHNRSGSTPYARAGTVTPSSVQQQARNAGSRFNPPQSNRHSASVEPPAPVTVDPTQVYDPYPEQQRLAQQAAERRQKAAAIAEQARKEEEEREAAKKREADRIAEEAAAKERARLEVESKAQAKKTEAASKAAARVETQKEERARMQAARANSKAARTAAATSSNVVSSAPASTPNGAQEDETDMERRMREMFKIMREYNAKDPALLARLWEEERNLHVEKSTNEQSPPQKSAKTGAKPVTTKEKRVSSTQTPTPALPTLQPAPAPPQPSSIASAATHSAPSQAQAQAPVATIWPPGKKQQLAITAAAWLNNRSAVVGKSVSSEQIVQLLDQNPSYPRLCEILESWGLLVDRPEFARQLLKAAPELAKGPPTTVRANPNQPAPRGPAGAGIPPATSGSPAQLAPGLAAQSSTPVNGAAHQPTMFTQGSVLAPSMAPPLLPYPNQGSSAPEAQNRSSAPVTPAPELPKKPMTKEEAARKRTFAELVDLTADDDSDQETLPPAKMPTLESQHPTLQEGHGAVNTVPPMNGTTAVSPANAPDISNAVIMPPRAVMPIAHSRAAELKGKILVQPIERNKVARKSHYHPATIARDVLLACGRHPRMKPLNSHLQCMNEFLNEHSNKIDHSKFDLATIDWAAIDPGSLIPDPREAQVDNDADDESDYGAPAAARTAPQQVYHENGTVSLVHTQGPPGLPEGRKRERPWIVYQPPGITATPAQGSGTPVVRIQPRAHANQPSSSGAPTQTRPIVSVNSSAAHIPSSGAVVAGYSALRQRDENGNIIKKKGRPFGWRKSVHSKSALGLDGKSGPTTSGEKQLERRGRPAKTASADTRVSRDPVFNEYECRWEGCDARLHNVDTLRKHIAKIHGALDDDGRYVCLWDKCATSAAIGQKGKGSVAKPVEYEDLGAWMVHMEGEHVMPLARTLGDGPRSGLSDTHDSEQSESYLSDAIGRYITPRSRTMDRLAEDEDEAQQSESLAPVLRRGMPRVRGRLSEDQRTDELKLQQLEAKKLAVGPLLDRGGARLATDARRKGLYDDEDFEGAYSADDGPVDDDG